MWTGAAFTLFFSFLFGGGTIQGLRSDALIQIISLGLLSILAWQIDRPFRAVDGWPLAIVATLVLLFCGQFIWLPPAIWSKLPGRDLIASVYSATNIDLPWLPLSLDPAASWRSALSLIPPIAVFLAVVQLPWRGRRSLSLMLVCFGVVSVIVGLAQLTLGERSGLYLYPISNFGSSVGFFANRNHYAAFLYSMIPLAAAWVIGVLGAFELRLVWLIGLLLAGVTFLLGLGMSQSRAGIVLGIFAAMASMLLAIGSVTRIRKVALTSLFVMSVTAVALVVQYGLAGILSRLDTGIAADYRLVFARVTADAARSFQPIGSGFGTFPAIYPMFEQTNDLVPAFVNHAHNDWFEVWLEGGWPAIGLAVAFLFWLGRASLRLWRGPIAGQRDIDCAHARAAGISLLLLMLHSMVDYPLRTSTNMCLFAFLCALIIEPPRERA
ncbi:O-antigen ligase family protein [Bradyrhizobium sp. ORS 111]|uniref:O-antigen ligase family protein n=1 Tax=Bradyrhizobium sp. ORS 111 TaxID=1685958 RepID=UPI00388DBEB4